MAIKNNLLFLVIAYCMQLEAHEPHQIYGVIKKKDDLHVTEYLQTLSDSNNTKFHALYYKQVQRYEVYEQLDVIIEGQGYRNIVLHENNDAKKLFDIIEKQYTIIQGNLKNCMAYTPQRPRVL